MKYCIVDFCNIKPKLYNIFETMEKFSSSFYLYPICFNIVDGFLFSSFYLIVS